MAAVFDRDDARVDEDRPRVAAFGGALGECAKHVDFGDRVGGVEKVCSSSGDALDQLVEELGFESFLTGLSSGDCKLELFELRRHIPFTAAQRLLPKILRRHASGVTLAHFDRVAERTGILHFERFYAGSISFALL